MHDPKALLLARLATERAGLWQQLLNLDEGTICRQPIAGERSMKDIVAGVAAWDRIRLGQMELLVAGRAHQIQTLDIYVINNDLYAQRRSWPLDMVMQDVTSARAQILALAEALKWNDIQRDYFTLGGARCSLRSFLERRGVYDGLYADQIQAWRTAVRPKAAPGPKCVLAPALDAIWDALLAWGRILAPESLGTRPVCGSWTMQDVVGHLADRHAAVARGLAALAEGEAAGGDFDEDRARWNYVHAAARQGEPFATTLVDFARVRAELRLRLKDFDDAALAQPANTPVHRLRCYYFWFSACATHTAAHVHGLNEELGEAG